MADSPTIRHLSWGRIETENHPPVKDAKLYPGGCRSWDWNEHGTRHSPGIQPGDVEELLQHDPTVVVLSKGIHERLQVPEETLRLLRSNQIPFHVLPTEEAVRLYNDLAAKKNRVAGLFHSTC